MHTILIQGAARVFPEGWKTWTVGQEGVERIEYHPAQRADPFHYVDIYRAGRPVFRVWDLATIQFYETEVLV